MAMAILAVILTLCTHFILDVNGALSTSTTNAAFKKQVVAERTCGSPSEKYFASSQNDVPPRFRKSQICDASSPNNSHNASYLVDGNRDTFWQSTSMVNRANITIDFSGPMHKVKNVYKSTTKPLSVSSAGNQFFPANCILHSPLYNWYFTIFGPFSRYLILTFHWNAFHLSCCFCG